MKKLLFALAISGLFFTACNNGPKKDDHDHSGHDHSGHNHGGKTHTHADGTVHEGATHTDSTKQEEFKVNPDSTKNEHKHADGEKHAH